MKQLNKGTGALESMLIIEELIKCITEYGNYAFNYNANYAISELKRLHADVKMRIYSVDTINAFVSDEIITSVNGLLDSFNRTIELSIAVYTKAISIKNMELPPYRDLLPVDIVKLLYIHCYPYQIPPSNK